MKITLKSKFLIVNKHHLKVVMMLQMRIWMNRIAKTSASPEVELGGGLAASGLS